MISAMESSEGPNPLLERLREALLTARGDVARRSVEEISRAYERTLGEEFFVHNTTIKKYEEQGSQPSPAKLLTLARIYNVRIGDFYRAIGATDAEICGHVFSEEEKSFIAMMKADPEAKRLHQALQAALMNAKPEDVAFLRRALEFVMTGLQRARPEEVSEKPPATRPLPSNVLPMAPVRYLDHDEPQELRMEDLPAFTWNSLAASPPDLQNPESYVKMPVLAHMAKGGRFVIRVLGDSMEPEIRDRDLVIVDTRVKEPRNGDMVVALINRLSTLKKFRRKGKRVTLNPINPNHKEIPVTEADDFQIQGVVVGLMRDFAA